MRCESGLTANADGVNSGSVAMLQPAVNRSRRSARRPPSLL